MDVRCTPTFSAEHEQTGLNQRMFGNPFDFMSPRDGVKDHLCIVSLIAIKGLHLLAVVWAYLLS